MGVATGCGCKEVYRFPHITYPYSSCICSFLQQHPYFLFIKKIYIRIGLNYIRIGPNYIKIGLSNCERSELSGVFNGMDFLYFRLYAVP